jgi:hypothetical protein
MPEASPHEPHSPVRDDDALGASEDLDRQPDGVPHSVIGMTFGFSVMLALLVAFMFAFGNTVSRVMAVAIVIFAVPVLVKSLNRRAAHDRDHLHPSR